MTLKHPSDDRLLLVDFPYLIGFVAFPLSFGGLIVFISFLLDTAHHRAREYLFSGAWTVLWFIGFAVFVKRCAFDLDLTNRTLRWRRRGVFENAGGELPFSDVRSINIECIRSSSTRSQMSACYRLVLHTKTDERIPLTKAYTGQRAPEYYDEVRRELSQALGQPAATIDDDIAELIKAKRQADAVMLTREAYRIDYDEARRRVEAMSGTRVS